MRSVWRQRSFVFLRAAVWDLVIVGLMLLFVSPCLKALTVDEVLDSMERAQIQQMERIEDLTVVQRSTGGIGYLAGDTTTYLRKAVVAGHLVYQTRTEALVLGKSSASVYDGEYFWSVNPLSEELTGQRVEGNPMSVLDNVNPYQTHYLGEEEIEGENTYVLKVDSLAQFWEETPSASSEDLKPGKIYNRWRKLWISSSTWMCVRVLTVSQETLSLEGGRVIDVVWKITTQFKDYRGVETALIPYRTVVTASMETDISNLSEEEKSEVEAIQYRTRELGSYEVEVISVKVNTGLSDHLFDKNFL